MCLEICPFLLGVYEPLFFYGIVCNVFNFITDFVYFNFLIIFFIRLAKGLSILCFQRLSFPFWLTSHCLSRPCFTD